MVVVVNRSGNFMDIVLCYTLNDVWELNVLFLYKKNKKFILDLLFNIYAHFPPATFHFLWG